MPDWAIALLGVVAGGVLGFLADYLRSHWKGRERYQEVLAEKRLEACTQLVGMLVDFHAEFAPITHGVHHLRMYDMDLREDERERGQKVKKRIEELYRFVTTNQLILGDKVLRAWERHISVFDGLRIRLNAEEVPHPLLIMPFNDAVLKLIDAVENAIKRQLRGADIEFVPTKEWQKLRGDGLSDAEKTVKDIKAKFNSERAGNSDSEIKN